MIDSHFVAASPEAVGIDSERLAALLSRAAKEVEEGLLPACQIAVARHGKIAALASFGDATTTTLFNVFSSTKAITSAAGWLLLQEGKLRTDERVSDIVPEFGTHGKDAITVEQLFTHTAGFPHAPFRVSEWFDRRRRLERFSEWTLNWPVGSRFEYHPTSSMYVIAEIIERRSGLAFHTFVRERIALPLGLPDMWVGCPPEQHHRIAPVVHVGDALTEADYAALGVPMPPVTEVTEDALTAFNSSESRQVPVPGGGGIMTAAELALFYQALINDGHALGGAEIWRPRTLADATKVRNRFPDLLGTPVNRALGVVVAGDEHRNARGFGHTNSPLAFGHGGAGGQIAWGDPVTGISLGYCTNGHDRNVIRQARRGISISNRAAVCASTSS
jgi:CubicO group peptidase (beta-lactamase class C family)